MIWFFFHPSSVDVSRYLLFRTPILLLISENHLFLFYPHPHHHPTSSSEALGLVDYIPNTLQLTPNKSNIFFSRRIMFRV